MLFRSPPLSGLSVLADHQVCATFTLARQRQVCFVPQSTVTLLSCHGINAFSLYSQGMHPTVPPQTCLFWVVYHPSRTYLPKEAWVGAVNRSFPLSPLPNHTPFYLLPLAHGPTMSYIGWVQAGGAWALHVLPFQICPRVCLLLMRLPRPGDSPSAFPGLSCGLSFGFSLHSGAGLRMMMGFTLLWPTFDFLYCLPR